MSRLWEEEKGREPLFMKVVFDGQHWSFFKANIHSFRQSLITSVCRASLGPLRVGGCVGSGVSWVLHQTVLRLDQFPSSSSSSSSTLVAREFLAVTANENGSPSTFGRYPLN